MTYRVRFSNRAERAIKKIDVKIAKRILERIKILASNPFIYPYKKLKGMKNVFRIRIGDFRIIYFIDKKNKEILILRIGKRENVYE